MNLLHVLHIVKFAGAAFSFSGLGFVAGIVVTARIYGRSAKPYLWPLAICMGSAGLAVLAVSL